MYDDVLALQLIKKDGQDSVSSPVKLSRHLKFNWGGPTHKKAVLLRTFGNLSLTPKIAKQHLVHPQRVKGEKIRTLLCTELQRCARQCARCAHMEPLILRGEIVPMLCVGRLRCRDVNLSKIDHSFHSVSDFRFSFTCYLT